MPWWMPTWDNGMVAGLMFFTCAMAGWFVKTMIPVWRDQGIAKAKKIEADANLSESLVITTARQTDLMARQVAQLNDHGVKLDQHGSHLTAHGKRLDEHSFLLKEIREQADRNRCRAITDRSES